MSNLIKSVYFNVDPTKTRKIDSDERVEAFIPNIYEQPERAEDIDFKPFDMTSLEHLDGAGFEVGLNVISMDDTGSGESVSLSEEMQAERDEFLAQAKAEADAIIANAKAQAEDISLQAKADGFQKGTEEARISMNEELERLKGNLQSEYEQRYAELEEERKNLEPNFAELVIALVKKITGVVCENKRDVILYLIGNAIRNMGRTSSVVLHVSKNDIALVASKKNALEALMKDISNFDVVEDGSLSENQCIIETDNRIIDCSLDAELQNLEEQMKLLVL